MKLVRMMSNWFVASFMCCSLALIQVPTKAFVPSIDPSVAFYNRFAQLASIRAKKSRTNDDEYEVDPRKEALDGVLNNIQRSYGKGSIMKLGDAGNMVVDCISSGALTLDVALGGGYPVGRVVEIYGPESSGMYFDDYLIDP